MSSETQNGDGAQPEKIEFLQFHQPGLKDGDYQITVTQEIHTLESQRQKIPSTVFTTQKNFSVSGERFELNPQDIYSVFPPDGSLGEHSNVLPHLMLGRSTLPWERTANDGNEEVTWLALLLFHDDEQLSGTLTKQEFVGKYTPPKNDSPSGEAVWNHLLDASVGWLKAKGGQPAKAVLKAKAARASETLRDEFAGLDSVVEAILDQFRTPRVLTLKDLMPASDDVLKWPGITLEVGQHEDDKAAVIDVPRALLEKILPAEDELALLTHVRQGKDANDRLTGDELAVIIANRLPVKGASSTVHLVSVEERYNGGAFNFQGAEADDAIRLVSLKSWSFACADEKQSFKGLLTHLQRDPATLRLQMQNAPDAAQKYLSRGCTPLPHHLRRGGNTVSWYHGPLVPGTTPAEISLPVRAADELVHYDRTYGMFDVSYAAAWELGRLLALQSKQFSVSLYNWKRAHAQQIKQGEQQLLHSHLPPLGQTTEAVDIPEDISAWFDDLSLLKGVPFNYLVPDERMLPAEAIRFFLLDHLWVDCLLDGAFSIGRVSTSDQNYDEGHEESPAANSYEMVSGFLLRSDVVAGWPGLLVDAFDGADPDAPANQLKLLRMERLSAGVLLCLFEGELKRVEIHQKPETIHFGLDRPDDEHPDYYKSLRGEQGQTSDAEVSPVPWRPDSRGVVKVAELATSVRNTLSLASITSATFALQMIEGVEKVTLLQKQDAASA